jgi:hypothetical protein
MIRFLRTSARLVGARVLQSPSSTPSSCAQPAGTCAWRRGCAARDALLPQPVQRSDHGVPLAVEEPARADDLLPAVGPAQQCHVRGSRATSPVAKVVASGHFKGGTLR